MTTTKNPTSSKTAAARSAKAAAGTPAKAATGAAAKTPASAPADGDQDHRRTVSVTIPVDSALVGVAVRAATLPVTAAKRVAQNKNGLPAYLAVLRRWGPLKPPAGQNAQTANGTTSE